MAAGNKQPTSVAEQDLHSPEENGAGDAVESRKLPVAYEEVVLTEEAAELLEQMRQENQRKEQPARKPRRIPTAEESAIGRGGGVRAV